MSTEKKIKTGTARLDELEANLGSLYQVADNMARDLNTIKEAVKLLAKKVDAIVKLSSSEQKVSDESIGKLILDSNVQELKDKIDNMVSQGLFRYTEEVKEGSFIVGQEVDAEGKVINPRIQFPFAGVKPELQEKLKGAKVGQILDLQEGKLKLEILELYDLVQVAVDADKAEEQAAQEASQEAPQEPAAQPEQSSPAQA